MTKLLVFAMLQCLLTSYFCIVITRDEKDFFLVLILKVLYIFIKLVNFSFFSISGWGIDLHYCNVEWFALETNGDHYVVYEVAPKSCILDFFVDSEGYSTFSK